MPSLLNMLRALTAYPVPRAALEAMCACRGLDAAASADAATLAAPAYRLAQADVWAWVAEAPNITQGGQSYSFTDAQREAMRRRARRVYAELKPDEAQSRPLYGYKGDRL